MDWGFRFPTYSVTFERAEMAKSPYAGLPEDRWLATTKKSIFANRSYAQAPSDSKKSKSGYYLAVNFEQFSESVSQPKIRMVRFGWLDHSDWIGQRAETGQQARLNPATESLKLLRID